MAVIIDGDGVVIGDTDGDWPAITRQTPPMDWRGNHRWEGTEPHWMESSDVWATDDGRKHSPNLDTITVDRGESGRPHFHAACTCCDPAHWYMAPCYSLRWFLDGPPIEKSDPEL